MFNNIINGSCEDIHRVNLPLYACGAMQLPPYQLLRIFGGILDGHLNGYFGRASGRYLIGCYQMRG